MTPVPRSSAAKAFREAYAGAKRACYAGLDALTLREELARRIARAVPVDACALSVADPEVGVLTHTVAAGVPPAYTREFVLEVYPEHEASLLVALARSGVRVTSAVSPECDRLARRHGLGRNLRLVPSVGGALWGAICLMRETGGRGFDDADRRLLARLAPHIARGFRSALLRASPTDAARGGDRADGAGTGVVVYDGRGRVVLRDRQAARYLDDLGDPSRGEVVPTAVGGVLARLRWTHRRPGPREDEPLDAALRARGRSGRWYTLRASLAEPNAAGEAYSVVTIGPIGLAERAGLLARLYGLTPREREVLRRLARGESSKQIAAALGISIHTVQDFVDGACAKVGVRGRKALLAKIFFDAGAAGDAA
ncbi:MAG TPA: LuxR C-terminal-related transcriptional regulator [Gemmatimonadales bacterium]|nr:LuxR C-terminal-related transcriptional regulator [Gemmatimonadales bacterium]